MTSISIFGLTITIERIPEWKRKALKEAAKVKYTPFAEHRGMRLQDFL